MSLFTVGALTRKGKALIAKCETRNTGIKITKAVSGSGPHEGATPEVLENLTALTAPEQEFSISNLATIDGNSGVAVITVVLHNRGLSKLYYLNELGIYAEDPDEGEILYCILVSELDTVYMPPDNASGGISTITERIYIEVTNAEKTTISTTGAVVSATAFEELKKLVDEVTGKLKGGKAGQVLTKTGEGEFQYTWKDESIITRPFKEFPGIGHKDALYIDSESTEFYIWKELSDGKEGYFKLPLGAEASQTLQKQITENLKSIAELRKNVAALQNCFSEVTIIVPAAGWEVSVEDDINVYSQEIEVKGMTEKTDGKVFPYIHETSAGAVVKELDAAAIFFSRGTSDSQNGKIALKCYKKVPKADFGITFQGAKEE